MAKLKLRVVLDSNQSAYKPGETITGHVEIMPLKDCMCKKLAVCCQSLSYGGTGTKLGDEEGTQVLFAGGWLGGTSALFPFKLVVPQSPFTQEEGGQITKWYVIASAELGRLTFVECSTAFVLDPRSNGPAYNLPGKTIDPLTATYLSCSSWENAIWLFLVTLPFIIFGPLLAFSTARALYTGSYKDSWRSPDDYWAGMIFGALVTLVGLAMLARVVYLFARKPTVPTLRQERLNKRKERLYESILGKLDPSTSTDTSSLPMGILFAVVGFALMISFAWLNRKGSNDDNEG